MVRAYFRPLTGVRAVAALLVFAFHSKAVRLLSEASLLRALDLSVGVNVFFVLSGFLITLRYANSPWQAADWRRYLLNRFARVYPMWFVLSTVAFAWLMYRFGLYATQFGYYLLNLSLLKGYSKTWQFTGIAAGWTLTVEESFYLLAPGLFLLLRRGWRPRNVLVVAMVAILLVGVALTALLHGRFQGFFTDYEELFSWTLAGHCLEFFTGAGLALYIRRRGAAPRHGGSFTWGATGAVVALLLLHAWVVLWVPQLWWQIRVGFFGVLLPLPLAAGFYGLLTERTGLSRLLSTPAAEALGKASYIFYLIHAGPVHNLLRGDYEQLLWSSPALVLVDLALTVVSSLALYRWVEAPLNRWIRAWKV